ncbi:N/A [soil metagenome]
MIIGAVAILAGCGAEDSTSIAPSESLDAVTLLTQASDSLAETETLRFNLEIDGDTFVDEAGTIRLLAARGDLARPDRVDVEFQVELLGAQTVSIRMITIDDEAWTTNLLSGAWEPSPEEFGYNPTVLFDDQGGLGPVAGRLNNPEVLDAETIGGRETWPVQGTVDNDTISSLTAGTADGEVITVTLWVDQESSNVLQLQLTEPDDTDKENPATWTMRLTGHNQDVTIERPDLAD